MAGYTKLRAIIYTKEDQSITRQQLWDLEGYSNRTGTNARTCPDRLLTISTEIWELIKLEEGVGCVLI